MRSRTSSSASGSSPQAAGVSGERGRRIAQAAAAIAVLGAPATSWALFNERVELWAAENLTHDSNVLRLSKDVNPPDSQRGDTISTTHVGGTFNAFEGQQHFTAEATYFRSNFRHFNDF